MIRFDYLRKQHIVKIPIVGKDGTQTEDVKGNPIFTNILIGKESEIRASAKRDLEKARKVRGGLSLLQFMSGYGAIYYPEALWEREQLAKISNTMTTTLMFVILFAVLAVYLAAFVIEIAGRSTAT